MPKSRPVGYGLIRAGVRTAHQVGRCEGRSIDTSGIRCAGPYRTLRDGSFNGRGPRHSVPGYDRTVPPGLALHPCTQKM
jgi:hypothetical protein